MFYMADLIQVVTSQSWPQATSVCHWLPSLHHLAGYETTICCRDLLLHSWRWTVWTLPRYIGYVMWLHFRHQVDSSCAGVVVLVSDIRVYVDW